MTCTECKEKLSEYLDGMLEDGEKSVVQAHLESCAACAESLGELRRLVTALGTLNVEPPASFAAYWREAIRGKLVKRSFSWVYRVGAVAAALVIGVSVWRVWPMIGGVNSPVKMERAAMPLADNETGDQAEQYSAKLAPAATEPQTGGAAAAQSAELPAPAAPVAPEAADIAATEQPAPAVQPAPNGSAQPEGASNADSSTPQMSVACEPAAGTDVLLGTISFEFSGTDSQTANAILVEALNRMGVKGTQADGEVTVPPMTAAQSNVLFENVRAVASEQNVSEVYIACTPVDSAPEATQITVEVK